MTTFKYVAAVFQSYRCRQTLLSFHGGESKPKTRTPKYQIRKLKSIFSKNIWWKSMTINVLKALLNSYALRHTADLLGPGIHISSTRQERAAQPSAISWNNKKYSKPNT